MGPYGLIGKRDLLVNSGPFLVRGKFHCYQLARLSLPTSLNLRQFPINYGRFGLNAWQDLSGREALRRLVFRAVCLWLGIFIDAFLSRPVRYLEAEPRKVPGTNESTSSRIMGFSAHCSSSFAPNAPH